MKTMIRQHKKTTNRFQKTPVITGLITLAFTGLISGCGSTELDALDASFGKSVNRMVEAQTRPPARPVDPATSQSAQALDGKLGEEVFKQYRKSTDQQKDVKSTEVLELNLD